MHALSTDPGSSEREVRISRWISEAEGLGSYRVFYSCTKIMPNSRFSYSIAIFKKYKDLLPKWSIIWSGGVVHGCKPLEVLFYKVTTEMKSALNSRNSTLHHCFCFPDMAQGGGQLPYDPLLQATR